MMPPSVVTAAASRSAWRLKAETMRLFTLVSLGAASATLDFATVAAALQVRGGSSLQRASARRRAVGLQQHTRWPCD